MYKKLSGMTGTADTEAAEFDKIYKLEVVGYSHERAADFRIETRTWFIAPKLKNLKPAVNGIIQEDGTRAGGIRQVLRERAAGAGGGSISIEKSEKIAEILKKTGHTVPRC